MRLQLDVKDEHQMWRISATPNQKRQVSSLAIIQRMETRYSQYRHYIAKEHSQDYWKDVFVHRADPKDCGHPRSGFLNLSTIDIWGQVIMGGCHVPCRMFSDVPKAPTHSKLSGRTGSGAPRITEISKPL